MPVWFAGSQPTSGAGFWFGASRHYPIMPKRLTAVFAASITYHWERTSSIRPTMPQRFTVRFATIGAGARLRAGGFLPVVLVPFEDDNSTRAK